MFCGWVDERERRQKPWSNNEWSLQLVQFNFPRKLAESSNVISCRLSKQFMDLPEAQR